MPKQTKYRLSVRRRVHMFVRCLNALPNVNQHGIAWYDCINTSDLYPADPGRAVLQQLVPNTFFGCVVRAIGIRASDEQLRHMGILFYNEEPVQPRVQRVVRAPLPKKRKDWAHLERQGLHAEFVRVLDELQRLHKSPIRLLAEQLVEGVQARN